MIVIGSFTSANSKRLTELAVQRNENSYQVTGKEDLKKEWFRSNKNPQPSPVFPSAPIAPRWVMLVSPKIDFFTSFLDLLPFL